MKMDEILSTMDVTMVPKDNDWQFAAHILEKMLERADDAYQ